MGFIFGVEKTSKPDSKPLNFTRCLRFRFPLVISLRRQTTDVIVYDDLPLGMGE